MKVIIIRKYLIIFDIIEDTYYFTYVCLFQRKTGHFKYTQIKPL